MKTRSLLLAATCLSGLVTVPAAAQSDVERMLEDLRRKVEEQDQLLRRQAAEIEQQRREIDEQRRQLQLLVRQQAEPGAAAPATRPAPARTDTPPQRPDTARQEPPPADAATRPPPETRPEQDITIIADVGGILTPKGRLTIEPTFTASHTSSNRFFFQGVEIVDAVLIGAIEATESRRNYLSAQLGLRLGITDRMEISGRIPFVYRDDRVESTIISQQNTPVEPSFLQNLDGHGLGDIEFGVQYQLNDGQGKWPFFVANLRAKSTTGTGPFEVKRDRNGFEQELATGSGFWSVEPSLTVIHQTDPGVLFANLGYIWNIARDVNVVAGNARIGRVNPGDTITGSFGIGFALNETFSMSMGYQHNYIFGTKSVINGRTSSNEDFQVGSLLFGLSLATGNAAGLNANVAIGVTDDSPDIEFSLRMPFSFGLFN